MTCTCFAWQSTGIPCSHATGVILFHKENPQTYVQAFLSFDAYRRTYANAIYPPAANVADNTPIFGPLQYSDNRNAQADRADRIIPPHARRALEGRKFEEFAAELKVCLDRSELKDVGAAMESAIVTPLVMQVYNRFERLYFSH